MDEPPCAEHRAAALILGALLVVAIALVERTWFLRWLETAASPGTPSGGLERSVGPGTFFGLRVLLGVAVACASWLAARNARHVANAVLHGRRALVLGAAALVDGLRGLPTAERLAWIGIALVVVVQRTADALLFAPHADELRTYFGSVLPGPLVALTVYTDFNNHVLHSLLASGTVHLPLPEPLDLRLPSVMAGVAVPLALGAMLRRAVGALPALVGALGLLALPPVAYYGFAARGYGICLLAAVVALGATVRLVEDSSSRRWRTVFVVSCAAGLWALPSHVYCVAVLLLARLLVVPREGRYTAWRGAALDGAFTALLAFVLYAPAVLRSGVGRVSSRRFLRRRSAEELASRLPERFDRVGDWLFGWSTGGLLLAAIVMAAAWLVWRSRSGPRSVRCLALVALLLPVSIVVLPFLHGVPPLTRSWLHVGLAPVLLAAVLSSLVPIVRHRVGWVAAAAAVLLGALAGVRGSSLAHARLRAAGELSDVASWVVLQEPGRVYATSGRVGLVLSYEARRAGSSVEIKSSRRWNPDDPDLAFEDVRGGPSPDAFVTRSDVPPPADLQAGYDLAHERGGYAAWVRR